MPNLKPLYTAVMTAETFCIFDLIQSKIYKFELCFSLNKIKTKESLSLIPVRFHLIAKITLKGIPQRRVCTVPFSVKIYYR